jgi:hypothetical protein
MPDCTECGKHYERVKNLESHRRAEHPTEAEKRILVDGLSPDPPSENVVPIDRPAEFIDGIELVEDPASQAGFFNHPERAAERARLNREVAEKITSDQKPVVGEAVLAAAIDADIAEDPYEKTERIEREWMDRVDKVAAKVGLVAVPEPVVQSHPSVLPPPAPRRHLDYVKHRCWDGFPEPMDAKWLLARVEEADSLLRVLAQPHVLAEWNRSLSE